MNTLEFLQRVLPSEGVYCLLTFFGGKPRAFWTDSAETLAERALLISSKGVDAYFGTASYKDNSSRTQANAHLHKTFFIDLDAKNGVPFADWKDALRGGLKLVQTLGLPKPIAVLSGNGIHLYWVLTEAIQTATWKPIAEHFKARAIEALGYYTPPEGGRVIGYVDPAVPADAARVLRIPGTINTKGGVTAKILMDAPDVTLEAFTAAIGYQDSPRPVATVQRPRVTLLDKIAATATQYPPAKAEVIVRKCQQIRWATEHQAEVSEPMWYAVLGVAAYCENPEATAIAWSKDYPDFDENKTISKMAYWKQHASGPPTCQRLALENKDGCKNCPFHGKVKSPAVLGLQQAEVAVAQDAPDEIASAIPLPEPFKRTATGIKFTIDDTDIDICNFDIYPVSYGRDENLGYEVCHFRWKRPHSGWQDLKMRQAALVEKHRDFPTIIADQGIVLPTNAQTWGFQTMLRAYMDELRQMKSMTNKYAGNGWKEEHKQFLIGNTLIKREENGALVEERTPGASFLGAHKDEMYATAGSAEKYAQFTGILEKGGFDHIMLAIGSSLSSIFYDFVGLNGIVVNFYGPTGSGKTLAQYFIQSVWGNPRALHYNAKFTQNALFHRLGFHCHLPMTIDETTIINPKEVGDFIYWVSQGKDKARLTRMADERTARSWATTVTTSSNKSFSSMLAAAGHENDAQQARLLDIPVEVHPLLAKNTQLGEQIYRFVTTNYGHIGPALLKHFMQYDAMTITGMIDEHKATFRKTYKADFSGQERYWETYVLLTDFALMHAQQLGLVRFDRTPVITRFLQQIGAVREAARENTLDAFDVLAEYTNEVASETLTIYHSGKQRGMPDLSRMPRGSIYARFDIYRPGSSGEYDRGTLMIDRAHFRRWLAVKGLDFRALMTEFARHKVDATPTSKKVYMGRDTSIKLGQTYVIGFNLAHNRLRGMIADQEVGTMDRTLGTLSLVH